MPGICVSVQATGELVLNAALVYPSCGAGVAMPYAAADSTEIVGLAELMDTLFTADPLIFTSVFGATFALPVTLYLVTWAYQSVINFGSKN